MSDLRSELLNKYDGFIFDLDGVIWRSKQAIPFAKEAIDVLREANKKVLFVTNNASETRDYQLEKLNKIGIASTANEFMTAGYATGLYLSQTVPAKSVHVMGTEQLKDEFRSLGLDVVEENAEVVAVGFDRDFSYKKLNAAFQNLYRKDCLLIACNKNPIYPSENGYQPGVGPSVHAIEYAIGRQADITIGKPESTILNIALDLIQTKRESTIMFGDILDMDILWAQRGGLKTAYVLSGVGVLEDIERLGIEPDYISDSIGHALGVC